MLRRFTLLLAIAIVHGFAPARSYALSATTTTLSVTQTSPQTVGTVETLTAVVKVSGTPTTAPGTVVFCDDVNVATANNGYCGVLARLGTAQITSSGSAVLNIRLAPGAHVLYAIFRGTPGASTPLGSSTSLTSAVGSADTGAVSFTVSVTSTTYPLVSVLSNAYTAGTHTSASPGTYTEGNPGNYSLTNTLVSSPPNLGTTTLGTAPANLSGATASFNDVTGSTTLGTETFGSTGSTTIFSPPAAYLPNILAATGQTGSQDFAGAQTIVKGDFNIDGIPDLGVFESASSSDKYLYLLKGNASPAGTFTTGSFLQVTDPPSIAVVGDFNSDDYPDIVYLASGHGVYSLINNKSGAWNGTSAEGVTVGPAGTMKALAVGDFNGDGNLDLAIGCDGTSTCANGFEIYLGSAAGTFTLSTQVATANPVQAIGAADFNGDGYSDLIVTVYGSTTGNCGAVTSGTNTATACYYQNTGTSGWFSSTTTATMTTNGSSTEGNTVLIGDLLNNGVLDFAYIGGGINVALNSASGPGTLSSPVTPSWPSAVTNTGATGNNSASGFAMGDFNNDGALDLAMGTSSGTLAFAAGVMSGGAPTGAMTSTTNAFYPASLIATTPSNSSTAPAAIANIATSLAAGDFTGSGLTDLAVALCSGTSCGGSTDVAIPDPVTILYTGYQTTSTTLTAVSLPGYGGVPISQVVDASTTSNYATVTSNTETLDGGVLTLTASPASESEDGTSVTLTATLASATITAQGGTAPTGDLVYFYNGATYMGSGAMNSSGIATYTTTTGITQGSNTLTAEFVGDSTNYKAYWYVFQSTSALSAPLTGVLTYIGAGAATKLAWSMPPPTTLTAGSAPGNVAVEEEDVNGNLVTNGIASVTLTITGPSGYAGYSSTIAASGGVATFSSIPALTITGSYNYAITNANSLTNPTADSETVTASATTLVLGISPSSTVYGTPVALTATLSPYSVGTLTTNGESVTFLNNGASIGTGTLSSGVATLTAAGLPVGINSLTASYAGDSDFNASTASAMTETTTPASFTAVTPGSSTVTVTLTFTTNFTLGSLSVTSLGATGTPFAVVTGGGGGTCAVGSAYGPGTTSSCTVVLSYTPTGPGVITGTVQAFDTSATPLLQAATNAVAVQYR